MAKPTVVTLAEQLALVNKMAADAHHEHQSQIDALRAELEVLRAQLDELRRAQRTPAQRAAVGIPADARAAFFAAHPMRKSATPAEITEWLRTR